VRIARVAITGASGFLGSSLAARMQAEGATVLRLTRGRSSASNTIAWDPSSGHLDTAKLEGVDAVVNLAGEPIDQRWTAARKRQIRDSRIEGTRLIANAIGKLRPRPVVLANGSAMGYYGDRGDELLDEASWPGSGFLAEVTAEWERASDSARDAGIRVVNLRTGLVLDKSGGALARMLLPFRLGIGGRLGSGAQWMSWIALDDWVGAVIYLLQSDTATGPTNLVAPNPVRNAEFTTTLARVLKRPSFAALPTFALDLIFGEMARETLLASQRVKPKRLMEAGYGFEYPELEGALRRALK
jgi:uncharacterized protein